MALRLGGFVGKSRFVERAKNEFAFALAEFLGRHAPGLLRGHRAVVLVAKRLDVFLNARPFANVARVALQEPLREEKDRQKDECEGAADKDPMQHLGLLLHGVEGTLAENEFAL